MKRFLVGPLFLATVFACSNTTSNGSAAQPNAATTQETTITGATTAGRQSSSSQGYEQATVGKGMSGGGDKSSATSPAQPKQPEPKLAVPRSPAPNPCSQCPPENR